VLHAGRERTVLSDQDIRPAPIVGILRQVAFEHERQSLATLLGSTESISLVADVIEHDQSSIGKSRVQSGTSLLRIASRCGAIEGNTLYNLCKY
jgi:hypothetical protein